MKFQEQRSSEMQGLAERLQGQRTAMVTIRDNAGLLASRPLTPVEMDSQGALWFMVSRQSLATQFAAGDQPVNVAFSDEGKSLFVSLAGTARLVDDMSRKVALWSTMARPWFSGADDPDLTLLCVQPRNAEIWDGPDSSVMRALAMATSVAAGRPIGLGERESVTVPNAAANTPANASLVANATTPF
jgi:general stress protein 26